jgi:hypothetical protein
MMNRPLKGTRGRTLDEATGFPLIGRFRKGKKDNRGLPVELPHWLVTFEETSLFDPERAIVIWKELYGDEPRTIPNIRLLTDNPAKAFTATNERWGKGSGAAMCVMRCDGEKIYEEFKDGKLDRSEKPCRFPVCGGLDSKQRPVSCQLSNRLIFCVPEFSRRLGVMGYFMLTTHSHTDHQNIQGLLNQTMRLGVPLSEISFQLSRYPASVRTYDGLMVQKHLVRLDWSPVATGMLLESGANPEYLLPENVETVPMLASRNSAEFDDTIEIRPTFAGERAMLSRLLDFANDQGLDESDLLTVLNLPDFEALLALPCDDTGRAEIKAAIASFRAQRAIEE